MQLPRTNEIIFFDDFDSKELDRTKWNVEVTGKIHNHEQQAYIDSVETVFLSDQEDQANGVLVIQPRHIQGYVTPQGDSFDFVSGRINTRDKFDFTYGTIAARIKLPQGAGLWPAFWTLGRRGAWPCCGELDIMEYVGEKDWVSAAVHGPMYAGEAALVNNKYFLSPNEVTKWHIYSLDWMPNCLNFKVDGELIYRVSRANVEFFGPWAFEGNQFIILNLALGGNYPFKINGVIKPYYGMPEATVKAISDNEIKMLVDWVKVSTTNESHLQ